MDYSNRISEQGLADSFFFWLHLGFPLAAVVIIVVVVVGSTLSVFREAPQCLAGCRWRGMIWYDTADGLLKKKGVGGKGNTVLYSSTRVDGLGEVLAVAGWCGIESSCLGLRHRSVG